MGQILATGLDTDIQSIQNITGSATGWADANRRAWAKLASGVNSLGTAALANTGTGSGNVPVLNASGDIPISVVPSLPASQITSGTLPTTRGGTGFSGTLDGLKTHLGITGSSRFDGNLTQDTLTLRSGSTNVAEANASIIVERGTTSTTDAELRWNASRNAWQARDINDSNTYKDMALINLGTSDRGRYIRVNASRTALEAAELPETPRAYSEVVAISLSANRNLIQSGTTAADVINHRVDVTPTTNARIITITDFASSGEGMLIRNLSTNHNFILAGLANIDGNYTVAPEGVVEAVKLGSSWYAVDSFKYGVFSADDPTATTAANNDFVWIWDTSGSVAQKITVANLFAGRSGGGSGVSLPANARGFLQNDGSGGLTWASSTADFPTNAYGYLRNNGSGTLIWDGTIDTAAIPVIGTDKGGLGVALNNSSNRATARTRLGIDDWEHVSTSNNTAVPTSANNRIYEVNTQNGSRTMSLPANPSENFYVIFRKAHANNTMTVSAGAGDNINGATSVAVQGLGDTVHVRSKGSTGWVAWIDYAVQPLSLGGTGATNAAGARTNLGLGSLAVKSSILASDLPTIAVNKGGTGATTATAARTALRVPASSNVILKQNDTTTTFNTPSDNDYVYVQDDSLTNNDLRRLRLQQMPHINNVTATSLASDDYLWYSDVSSTPDRVRRITRTNLETSMQSWTEQNVGGATYDIGNAVNDGHKRVFSLDHSTAQTISMPDASTLPDNYECIFVIHDFSSEKTIQSHDGSHNEFLVDGGGITNSFTMTRRGEFAHLRKNGQHNEFFVYRGYNGALRPIELGGTNATTTSAARDNLGIPVSNDRAGFATHHGAWDDDIDYVLYNQGSTTQLTNDRGIRVRTNFETGDLERYSHLFLRASDNTWCIDNKGNKGDTGGQKVLLHTGSTIAVSQLAAGTTSQFLRGDRTWATPPTGSGYSMVPLNYETTRTTTSPTTTYSGTSGGSFGVTSAQTPVAFTGRGGNEPAVITGSFIHQSVNRIIPAYTTTVSALQRLPGLTSQARQLTTFTSGGISYTLHGRWDSARNEALLSVMLASGNSTRWGDLSISIRIGGLTTTTTISFHWLIDLGADVASSGNDDYRLTFVDNSGIGVVDVPFSAEEFRALTLQREATTLPGNTNTINRMFFWANSHTATPQRFVLHVGRGTGNSVLAGIEDWTSAEFPNPVFELRSTGAS